MSRLPLLFSPARCGFCDMPHQSIAIFCLSICVCVCVCVTEGCCIAQDIVLYDLFPADAAMLLRASSAGKLNRLLGGPAAVAVACWQHFGPNFAYINIYEFIKSEPHTLARSQSFAGASWRLTGWMNA